MTGENDQWGPGAELLVGVRLSQKMKRYF